MAKNDFKYGGWNSYTLNCGMWLWNRDSEFTARDAVKVMAVLRMQ